MANRHVANVLPNFRRAILLRDGAGLSDGQLLDCYLANREETAFAALVRRLASISTEALRPNKNSLEGQEKRMCRSLPPNQGMGVGRSANLDATR
jgi:hypothetical protein